ncbi:uncharacterized protein LOC134824226 isoform X1 [Bolinopsis microptera]|uniref:uncharacterized protein LOC134824226 isoform X1 n=1 Tax=Bolinopsis microptera TaxID=2820187 RepID=UPI00307986E4
MNGLILHYLLPWFLLEQVTSEASGDEFRKELGERKLKYDETLNHYVIQIEKNQTAILECTSPESATTLTKEENRSEPCIPERDVIYERDVGDITISCLMEAHYSHTVQWFSCYLKAFPNSKTVIIIAVVPAIEDNSKEVRPIFGSNLTLMSDEDLSWWCLSEHTPIYKPSAGHLLYFKWFHTESERRGNHNSRPMTKVKKLELWKMEINTTFSCNGSEYMVDAEFHCFGKLPTGLPSIQHCHDWGKAMVILLEVLLYVCLYATLVIFYKSVGTLRRVMRRIRRTARDADYTKNRLLILPRCKGRPYTGIDNLGKLIIKLEQPAEPAKCDHSAGRFKDLISAV